MSRVKFIAKFQNLNVCHFFLNLWLWLCLLLTWDLIWITSMGNHGAAWGISERRRSNAGVLVVLVSYWTLTNMDKCIPWNTEDNYNLNNTKHNWSVCIFYMAHWFNTLRSRQSGRYFPDDIFKCIFLNENMSFDKDFTQFCFYGWINNIPALVWIMAWHQQGDKPLSEPMMA